MPKTFQRLITLLVAAGLLADPTLAATRNPLAPAGEGACIAPFSEQAFANVFLGATDPVASKAQKALEARSAPFSPAAPVSRENTHGQESFGSVAHEPFAVTARKRWYERQPVQVLNVETLRTRMRGIRDALIQESDAMGRWTLQNFTEEEIAHFVAAAEAMNSLLNYPLNLTQGPAVLESLCITIQSVIVTGGLYFHSKRSAVMDILRHLFSNNFERTLIQDPYHAAAEVFFRLYHLQPFMDGNTRPAWLLMNFVLLKAGFPALILDQTNFREFLRLREDIDFLRPRCMENMRGFLAAQAASAAGSGKPSIQSVYDSVRSQFGPVYGWTDALHRADTRLQFMPESQKIKLTGPRGASFDGGIAALAMKKALIEAGYSDVYIAQSTNRMINEKVVVVEGHHVSFSPLRIPVDDPTLQIAHMFSPEEEIALEQSASHAKVFGMHNNNHAPSISVIQGSNKNLNWLLLGGMSLVQDYLEIYFVVWSLGNPEKTWPQETYMQIPWSDWPTLHQQAQIESAERFVQRIPRKGTEVFGPPPSPVFAEIAKTFHIFIRKLELDVKQLSFLHSAPAAAKPTTSSGGHPPDGLSQPAPPVAAPLALRKVQNAYSLNHLLGNYLFTVFSTGITLYLLARNGHIASDTAFFVWILVVGILGFPIMLGPAMMRLVDIQNVLSTRPWKTFVKRYPELAHDLAIRTRWGWASFPATDNLNRLLELLQGGPHRVYWRFWTYPHERPAPGVESARHFARGEAVIASRWYGTYHDWSVHVFAFLVMGPVSSKAFQGMYSFLVTVLNDPLLQESAALQSLLIKQIQELDGHFDSFTASMQRYLFGWLNEKIFRNVFRRFEGQSGRSLAEGLREKLVSIQLSVTERGRFEELIEQASTDQPSWQEIEAVRRPAKPAAPAEHSHPDATRWAG